MSTPTPENDPMFMTSEELQAELSSANARIAELEKLERRICKWVQARSITEDAPAGDLIQLMNDHDKRRLLRLDHYEREINSLTRQLSESQAHVAVAEKRIFDRDTKIVSLEAQLASAREDGARLDWWEKNGHSATAFETHWYISFAGFDHLTADTFRSAIDSARGVTSPSAVEETGEKEEWKPKIGDWFLIKTSLCEEGKGCSEENPCVECLEMSNRFVISAEHCGEYFFFGGGFCNRDGGCRLDETHSYILTTKPKDSKHHFKAEEGRCVHVSECIPLPPPSQGKERE